MPELTTYEEDYSDDRSHFYKKKNGKKNIMRQAPSNS